jgi:hypothetical protein
MLRANLRSIDAKAAVQPTRVEVEVAKRALGQEEEVSIQAGERV